MVKEMKKGYCVALTGGIACGKSTVAGFWRRWGAEMIDADEIAHRLIAPGGVCVEEIQQAFGPRVWAPDGGIDRTRGPCHQPSPRPRTCLSAAASGTGPGVK